MTKLADIELVDSLAVCVVHVHKMQYGEDHTQLKNLVEQLTDIERTANEDGKIIPILCIWKALGNFNCIKCECYV